MNKETKVTEAELIDAKQLVTKIVNDIFTVMGPDLKKDASAQEIRKHLAEMSIVAALTSYFAGKTGVYVSPIPVMDKPSIH